MTCEVCKFIAIVFSVVDPATIFQRSFTLEAYFKFKHKFSEMLRICIYFGKILSRVQFLGPQHCL